MSNQTLLEVSDLSMRYLTGLLAVTCSTLNRGLKK
ncbi:Transcriptional regulator [Aeromonas bestiarum]